MLDGVIAPSVPQRTRNHLANPSFRPNGQVQQQPSSTALQNWASKSPHHLSTIAETEAYSPSPSRCHGRGSQGFGQPLRERQWCRIVPLHSSLKRSSSLQKTASRQSSTMPPSRRGASSIWRLRWIISRGTNSELRSFPRRTSTSSHICSQYLLCKGNHSQLLGMWTS
jgi:hypothetical protein